MFGEWGEILFSVSTFTNTVPKYFLFYKTKCKVIYMCICVFFFLGKNW